eukprot:scaffold9145_cov62-Phaeocystis_antarctica.AAC.4
MLLLVVTTGCAFITSPTRTPQLAPRRGGALQDLMALRGGGGGVGVLKTCSNSALLIRAAGRRPTPEGGNCPRSTAAWTNCSCERLSLSALSCTIPRCTRSSSLPTAASLTRSWSSPTSWLTPKRCLSSNDDFATSRRDARQLLVGQDCIA